MERIVVVKFLFCASFAAVLFTLGLLAEDPSVKGVGFAFFLFLGAPVLILGWKDFGQALRKAGQTSKRMTFWGRVFGYPQAAFGLVCAIVGLGIFPLLLYKWWVLGQAPQGPWLSAPLGFLAFGVYFMRDAFRPPQEPIDDGPDNETHGI